MRRTALTATVATALALAGSPGTIAGAAAGTATSVTSLSGTEVEGGIQVTGSAAFGGQAPVEVADDPANDANVTPTIGDTDGIDRENGVDLLGAALSVPDPAAPELLVQWQVAALAPSGGIPEGTLYTLPFKVGTSVYQVQAKYSRLADADTAADPQGAAGHVGGAFELKGNCTINFMGTGLARCSHLAWIAGGFDTLNSIVSARVPLGSAAAPGIVGGAQLKRNDSTSPDLNDIIAGYTGASVTNTDDHMPFGDSASYAFTIPTKQVALGVAPTDTDPEDVSFTTPAELAANDTFSGTVSTSGLAPGAFDVYARACFADNCGIRSLGGLAFTSDGSVGTLRLTQDEEDSYVFWPGGKIGNQVPYGLPLPNNGAVQTCSNTPCFTYKLNVASPGAARLRIALDTTTRNDNFMFQVTPPGGAPLPAVTNGNAFNSETFITNPAAGAYTILVRPYSAQNTRFTMRAKLEATIPTFAPNADGLLLPDLRPTAPYELGWAAPVLNNGMFPGDDTNPPLDVGGVHPVSCTPDEALEDGAVRCLRLSFGLTNYGHGKFSVRWTGSTDSQPPGPTCGDGATVGCPLPATQCIEAPGRSPSFVVRPAGQVQAHRTHGAIIHVHYKDIIYTELYSVADPATGKMFAAGQGRKLGYSPANQAIADWYAFDQRTGEGSSVPGCPGTSGLGMAPGWGDVYRYQRPGNYVDFGTNPDGLYVVRLTADPLNNVVEVDETNNASYTYIRVTGDRIDILEHGRGQSPWDPKKQILKPRFPGGVPW